MDGQLQTVFGKMSGVIFQKINFEQFLQNGIECQTLVLNNIHALLAKSDDGARKCHSDITPAPTDADQVYQTDCFKKIITDINTDLVSLEQPAIDCLTTKQITFEQGSVQEILKLAESTIGDAVKSVVVIPAAAVPVSAPAAPESIPAPVSTTTPAVENTPAAAPVQISAPAAPESIPAPVAVTPPAAESTVA